MDRESSSLLLFSPNINYVSCSGNSGYVHVEIAVQKVYAGVYPSPSCSPEQRAHFSTLPSSALLILYHDEHHFCISHVVRSLLECFYHGYSSPRWYAMLHLFMPGERHE
jgi:hypothetical protein